MTFKLHTIVKINNNLLFQLKHCASWQGKYPYIHIFSKICIGLLVLEDQAEKIILTEYLWVFFQIWAENRIHFQ